MSRLSVHSLHSPIAKNILPPPLVSSTSYFVGKWFIYLSVAPLVVSTEGMPHSGVQSWVVAAHKNQLWGSWNFASQFTSWQLEINHREIFPPQKLAHGTNQGSLHLCRTTFQLLPASLWSETLSLSPLYPQLCLVHGRCSVNVRGMNDA